MSRPRISVIIPSYNRADLLQEAVESAAVQSLAPLEIIVVDDGSTDGTPGVLEKLSAGGIRVHRQENQGVSVARNTGAAMARGEYLAFLDSNDLWDRDKLMVQSRVHRSFPEAKWSVTGARIADPRGEVIPGMDGWSGFPVFVEEGKKPLNHFLSFAELRQASLRAGEESYTLVVGDLFPLLFAGNVVQPSAALVEARAFREAGGFDPDWRLAEETEFFHRLAARVPGGVVLEPLYSWRVGHAGNLVSPGNISTLIENAIRSLDRALQLREHVDERTRAIHERAVRRQLKKLAYTHLSNLDRTRVRQVINQATARFPDMRRELLPLYLASRTPSWVLSRSEASPGFAGQVVQCLVGYRLPPAPCQLLGAFESADDLEEWVEAVRKAEPIDAVLRPVPAGAFHRADISGPRGYCADEPNGSEDVVLPWSEIAGLPVRVAEHRTGIPGFPGHAKPRAFNLGPGARIVDSGQDRVGDRMRAKTHAAPLARPQIGPRHGGILRRWLLRQIHLSRSRHLCDPVDPVLIRDLLAPPDEVGRSTRSAGSVREIVRESRFPECDFQVASRGPLEDVLDLIPPVPGLPVQEPRRHKGGDRTIELREDRGRDFSLVRVAVIDGEANRPGRDPNVPGDGCDHFLDGNQRHSPSAQVPEGVPQQDRVMPLYPPIRMPEPVQHEDRTLLRKQGPEDGVDRRARKAPEHHSAYPAHRPSAPPILPSIRPLPSAPPGRGRCRPEKSRR
jgi:glycosyltransferase involved in cell wall biosynthesis